MSKIKKKNTNTFYDTKKIKKVFFQFHQNLSSKEKEKYEKYPNKRKRKKQSCILYNWTKNDIVVVEKIKRKGRNKNEKNISNCFLLQ